MLTQPSSSMASPGQPTSISIVAVTGGAAKSITVGTRRTDTGPVYSPDARRLPIAPWPGRFESDRYRISLYDRASGKTARDEAWIVRPVRSNGRRMARRCGRRSDQLAKDLSSGCDDGQSQAIVSDHYNSGATYVPLRRKRHPSNRVCARFANGPSRNLRCESNGSDVNGSRTSTTSG